MGHKVVSHDQKGGVTAGEINVNTPESTREEAKRVPRWLIVTGIVAGVVSALVALYQVLM